MLYQLGKTVRKGGFVLLKKETPRRSGEESVKCGGATRTLLKVRPVGGEECHLFTLVNADSGIDPRGSYCF